MEMEISERDRQLFEEFARDLNLSEGDIKEIESNEKFKERLCGMLSSNIQHSQIVTFLNHLRFTATCTTLDNRNFIADDFGIYELDSELLYRLTARARHPGGVLVPR